MFVAMDTVHPLVASFLKQRFTLWMDRNIVAICAIFLYYSCNHFPRARGEESPAVAKVRPFLAAKTLFHFATALRTDHGINFIHSLDQHGPGLAAANWSHG